MGTSATALDAGDAFRTMTISNPLGSNDITQVKIQVTTVVVSSAVTIGAAATGFTVSATVTGVGPWVVVIGDGSSVVLPVGADGRVAIQFQSNAATTTSGQADTSVLTTIVRDSTGERTIPSPTLYLTAATTLTVADSPDPITAGGSSTITVGTSPTGQAGFPVRLSADTTTGTFTPSTVTTTSTTVTSTYTETDDGTRTVTAKIGAPVGTTANGIPGGAGVTTTVLVNPNLPTKVTVSLSQDSTTSAITYLTAADTALVAAIADTYGNAVAPGAVSTVTFTATSGTVTGGPFTIAATATSSSPAGTFTPATTYGTFALISAVVTIPSGTFAGTYSGSSKQLFTSTFATAATVSLTTAEDDDTATTGFQRKAGKTATITVTLTASTQSNVPIALSLTGSTTGYVGSFNATSLRTGSAGTAFASLTIDTVAGSATLVRATVSRPLSTNPANTFLATDSPSITTIAGDPTGMKVFTFSDSGLTTARTNFGPAANVWVKVGLSDAFGNTAVVTQTQAIQVNLAIGAGTITATTVFITTSNSDTSGSGYTIRWTLPTALGSYTITASSPAFTTTAPKTVQVLSLVPTTVVTQPTVGATVTTLTPTIKGYANISLAAPGAAIVLFQYSLNGAGNVSVPITSTTGTGQFFTEFTVTVAANSTNSLVLYAIDSQSPPQTGKASVTFIQSTVPPPPPVPTGETFLAATPTSTVVAGITFANVSATNRGNTTLTVFVYVTVLNAAGQTVSLGISQQTVAAGATTQPFLFGLVGLTPGTYTVRSFVVTTTGVPVSLTSQATVNIS